MAIIYCSTPPPTRYGSTFVLFAQYIVPSIARRRIPCGALWEKYQKHPQGNGRSCPARSRRTAPTEARRLHAGPSQAAGPLATPREAPQHLPPIKSVAGPSHRRPWRRNLNRARGGRERSEQGGTAPRGCAGPVPPQGEARAPPLECQQEWPEPGQNRRRRWRTLKGSSTGGSSFFGPPDLATFGVVI